jgi:hypothetical protein
MPLAAAVLLGAYGAYPWFCRRGTTREEAAAVLPGDALVPHPETGYTLATTIAATPESVWPWLLQLGQGRGGFYTYEWVEHLLGAGIQNVDRIVPELQQLAVGDPIRLTPDPYFGQPGQLLTVAELEAPRALLLRQRMPNGSLGTWAFLLRDPTAGRTRLLFRRRAGPPSWFDRLALPGYYFMDRGMLAGIKRRAEALAGSG